jgi:hypothetical protein
LVGEALEQAGNRSRRSPQRLGEVAQAEMILGTPEPARGKTVDKHADIWVRGN